MDLLNVALLTRDWSVCDLSNRSRFSLLCCWSSLCLNLASLSCCAGSWNGKQRANAISIDNEYRVNAVNGSGLRNETLSRTHIPVFAKLFRYKRTRTAQPLIFRSLRSLLKARRYLGGGRIYGSKEVKKKTLRFSFLFASLIRHYQLWWNRETRLRDPGE